MARQPRLAEHQFGAQATPTTHLLARFSGWPMVRMPVAITLPHRWQTKVSFCVESPERSSPLVGAASCDGYPLRRADRPTVVDAACLLRQRSLVAAGLSIS
jgi:hypothetical protein